MHKPTLLYAEDDVETRENYAYILKQFFAEVYIAGDGKEALSLYREKKPDMLLLDISMPLLDGLELTKIIRKTDTELPIAILTAHSEQTKLFRAIPLGLTEYLLKPVDDTLLIKTMKEMIKKLQNSSCVSLKEGCIWQEQDAELFCKEQMIDLTKKETMLMKQLMATPGHYISKEKLMLEIWYSETLNYSHENKLVQLVYRLNKKITGVTGNQILLIENSYALGYKILSD